MKLLPIIVFLCSSIVCSGLFAQERYSTGELKSTGDKDAGTYTRYYKNGNPKYRLHNEGKDRYLTKVQWHENGNMKDTVYRIDSLTICHIEFYLSGAIKHKGYYIVRSYGDNSVSLTNDGTWTWYSPDGDSTSVVYKDEEVIGSGKEKSYFFDGILAHERSYSNGKNHGQFRSYYENGQLKESMIYRHGSLTDSSMTYYEDGNLKSEAFYRFGKLIGSYNEYHGNGNIYSRRKNLNDSLSFSEFYDSEGSYIRTILYNNRSKRTVTNEYQKGVLRSKNVHQRTDDGSTERYYRFDDEGILSEESYVISEKKWVQIFYNKNGEVIDKKVHNAHKNHRKTKREEERAKANR